mgnify:CR=1 FL=1
MRRCQGLPFPGNFPQQWNPAVKLQFFQQRCGFFSKTEDAGIRCIMTGFHICLRCGIHPQERMQQKPADGRVGLVFCFHICYKIRPTGKLFQVFCDPLFQIGYSSNYWKRYICRSNCAAVKLIVQQIRKIIFLQKLMGVIGFFLI